MAMVMLTCPRSTSNKINKKEWQQVSENSTWYYGKNQLSRRRQGRGRLKKTVSLGEPYSHVQVKPLDKSFSGKTPVKKERLFHGMNIP